MNEINSTEKKTKELLKKIIKQLSQIYLLE